MCSSPSAEESGQDELAHCIIYVIHVRFILVRQRGGDVPDRSRETDWMRTKSQQDGAVSRVRDDDVQWI